MGTEEIVTWWRTAPATAGVSLAVLHGSRARGDHAPESYWDFAVLTDGTPPSSPVSPLC